MTREEESLLAAVVAAPDDDTPRLVYADWLEEHGQGDRAEFIRLQCELARTPPADKKHAGLSDRAAALQRTQGHEWARGLQELCGKGEVVFSAFRRGLPARLHSNGPRLAELLPVAARACPVMELEIDAAYRDSSAPVTAKDFTALAKSPALAQVRTLDLKHLLPRELRTVLTSPQLTGLTELALHADDIDAAVRVLVATDLPARLRKLHLWTNSGEPISWWRRRLRTVTDPEWPALEELRVDGCELGTAGVVGLTFLRAPRLRVWHVGYEEYDPSALIAVLTLPPLARGIGVSFSGRAGTLPADWADAPPGPAKLRLRGWHNTADFVWPYPAVREPTGLIDVLTRHLTPRPLDLLDLCGNGLGPAEARTLASWPGLRQVRELMLVGNPLGDEGAAALAKSPHLDGIETLWVADTALGRAGKDKLKRRFGKRARVT